MYMYLHTHPHICEYIYTFLNTYVFIYAHTQIFRLSSVSTCSTMPTTALCRKTHFGTTSSDLVYIYVYK